MDRRHFLRSAAFVTGALAMEGFPSHLYAGTTKKNISDRITLGKTGIVVSRMAIGTGTNGWGGSSDQTRRFGIKGLSDLFQAGIDHGVFFWDSADQYGSHPHMREALKHIPREKVVILTKTHATSEREMQKDLDRFRKEIGTDYLDIVLLHCMTDDDWPEQKKGAMNVITKARQEGKIKAHGVSCHTLGALQAAAKSNWVQVDLARINPAGAIMDAKISVVANVLKQMKQSGKSIIGMKLFGAGQLTGRIDECLQYAAGQDFIDCFTIGLTSYNQLLDIEKRLPAASVRG